LHLSEPESQSYEVGVNESPIFSATAENTSAPESLSTWPLAKAWSEWQQSISTRARLT